MAIGLLHVRKEQLAALRRATPAAMLGYAINVAIALWALFETIPNIVLTSWAIGACGVCGLIGWRASRVGDRPPRPASFGSARHTAKPLLFAILLALPWALLTVFYAGAINGHDEIVLLALAVGMAASGSILLAPIPAAAVTYQSIILLPLVLKCVFFLGARNYLALGFLGLSYWLFLTLLITTTARMFDERLRATDELHASHQEIETAARTDALTGLANRRAFVAKLAAMSRAHVVSDYALLYLDLDRFKNINDVLGHHVGDEMLRACAKRIESVARSNDFVARLGGDEFAVIAEDTADRAAADHLARRLLNELTKPYGADGHSLNVGASIGIALSSECGSEGDELLKQADLAMYASKTSQESVRFFEPAMERRAKDRHELEAGLRAALKDNSFALYFQPIRKLASGSITGLEALIRWPQPSGQVLRPADFLPLADSLGLSDEIGDWVINEACAQAVRWPRDVLLAVNVSPLQISSGKLPRQVEQALARTTLHPRRLQLEIIEASLLQNDVEVRATLDKIRALGVSIALDDFGSGYSSLSYLVGFPFNRIKLDRQFIAADQLSNSWAIVRAVVQLARTLRCSVVAEGIEGAVQLERLRSIGVSDGQGFFLGKPKPGDETLALLHSRDAYRLPAEPVKYA